MIEQEQVHKLAQVFTSLAEPHTLDPNDYTGWRRLVVAALTNGQGTDAVWACLTPEQHTEITRADPEARPVEPVISLCEDSPAPELPRAASIDPSAVRGASPWLDAYIDFSRAWSPRAYDGFHVACGLWLLSTVAARRVVVHLGGERFTNLYIALVARTSIWAKSTTAKIVTGVLRQAGLDWLLAPDDSTPQRFIADLGLSMPSGFDDLEGEARMRAMKRMGFAAQRGWFYEEFGTKVQSMMRPSGFMADFRGILRAMDDCPYDYQYATLSRGTDVVRRPYLALLANMTPADLRGAAKRNDALWNDGFWARFAFVTPPDTANPSRARFPQGERIVPASLLTPLRQWHERLGEPNVTFKEVKGDGGAARKVPVVGALPVSVCTMAPGVEDAFYIYHDALCALLDGSDNTDLDGNYSRFAEKALRVAALLASLENDGVIDERHWAAGQTMAEGWRANLHHLYDQVNMAQPSEEKEREETALRLLGKLGEPTAAEVARYMRGVSSREVAYTLDGLVGSGTLERREGQRKGVIRYALIP